MDLATTRLFGLDEVLRSDTEERVSAAASSSGAYSSHRKPMTDLECNAELIDAVVLDDRHRLINLLFAINSRDLDRVLEKLLHYCCLIDSISCATVLISGELGAAAFVNKIDDCTGMSPLHEAARSHSARCVELLLKKRARTDVKCRGARGLLPLELSLSCTKLQVDWNLETNSIEDLVVLLSEKDLTTVRLLIEKTKEIDDVAYSIAIGGRIIQLTALLIVAAERVNEAILVLHEGEIKSKEKTTIYERVIKEALSLGRSSTQLRAFRRSSALTKLECEEKRKLLLREIELLQLFGAVAYSERKDSSPLILAAQAGDEAVVEILLKSNIDVNETDPEGNSALHFSLKSAVIPVQQQSSIVHLLLKGGARANQKNKLGLTALHFAAAAGNVNAVEILSHQDPECVNSKTVTKETPLFYAVRNNHINCAELLLNWGATAEVLNLRKERPIDFAKSQDMRFLLMRYNISHLNRPVLTQRKCTAFTEGDEISSDVYDMFLSMIDEDTSSERNGSIPKSDICKYFESSTGCMRGSKCFYAHSEGELCKPKQGVHLHSPSLEETNKRRIFVGGLPITLDSVSLHKYFEKHFGPVEDASIAESLKENESISRGFGFLTFKHESSAAAAVEAHYVNISGKQVEIKIITPKGTKQDEHQKLSLEHNDPNNSKAVKTPDTFKDQKMSWADRLIYAQPKSPVDSPSQVSSASFGNQKIPKWLKIFRRWLRPFLEDAYNHSAEGGYALSSLKADFRNAFGMELDHSSLGFSKLSDFMKMFPDLCYTKHGTLSRTGSPNHMVLLPKLPESKKKMVQFQQAHHPESTNDSGDGDSSTSKSSQEVIPVSTEYSDFASSTEESSPKVSEDKSAPKNAPPVDPAQQKNTSPDTGSKDNSAFSMPDLLSDARIHTIKSKGGLGGTTHEKTSQDAEILANRHKHVVLEVLARKRKNTSVFFLREFDFYENYKTSVKKGSCFGCNQGQMLWANLPCRHQLWCTPCKLEFTAAAVQNEHKCVVCDKKVENFTFVPSRRWYQSSYPALPKREEFPPLFPSSSPMGTLQRRGNYLRI